MNNSYSDKELVAGLIGNDNRIVNFFFYQKCGAMIGYIISKIYRHQAEKDELVNDLYLYLQENDWHKVRQFDFRSKLTTWVSVVATRYFIKKRNLVIENHELNPLKENGYDPLKEMLIKMDIHNALERMPNKRYSELLRDLYINDMEAEKVAEKMNVTIANFYNLKHRAIQQITQIMKKEDGYV